MRLLNKAFEWLMSRRAETKGDKRSSHFSLFSFSLVTVHLSLIFALSLAPSAFALDGSITAEGGGVIKYTGAASAGRAPGSKDVLLVFTNVDETASFELEGTTSAKILAVGGGGGGGGAYSTGFSGQYGGAGGGGAGGFVETNGLFGAGIYSITVGAGGAAGKCGSSRNDFKLCGGNGSNTVIRIDEADFITAFGGGGGGGETNGLAGASGGGGSQFRASKTEQYPQLGGQCIEGQGHKGGAGDKGLYGGGGGGAGGPGGDASTTNPTGGVGRVSNITGEEKWYAGGGGGAYDSSSETSTTAKPIAGGMGGGGQGARGTKVKATDGEPGTGGGGGGAHAFRTAEAGAGGSGIVIVRIAASLDGPLNRPTDTYVEYDGNPHSAVAEAPFYTIEPADMNTQTAVGNYTVKVTPAKDVKWTDGTSDSVTVTMTIYGKNTYSGTIEVTGETVSYHGAAERPKKIVYTDEQGEQKTDWLLVFTNAAASFKLPGTTSARILAVGGGGGGAGAYSTGFSGQYGGAGGGGAGGFVETNGLLGAGNYLVTVGAGGTAGKCGSSRNDFKLCGGNGSNTVLRVSGVDFITAFGGGGGGGETNGLAGASGGGGSQFRASKTEQYPQPGGQCIEGQGHKGGAGDVGLYGGGGGGAGGPGGDASTSNPTGGVGRVSNITGEEKWYAGGGGGAYDSSSETSTTAKPIAGGMGGGGQGARGTKVKATDGEPGTGGGGGGAHAFRTAEGGAGGCGVVIVRLSAAMKEEFKKPTSPEPITYDRNAHTSVYSTVFYDVTDDWFGTTVGVYVATATLKTSVKSWPDGDENPAVVTMKIEKCSVKLRNLHLDDWEYGLAEEEKPNPTYTVVPDWVPFVFDYRRAGSEKFGDDWDDWTDSKPDAVGSYLVRARLTDTNNLVFAEQTEQTAPFKVTGVTVTFSDDFAQKDWMVGTPDGDTPAPQLTVSPSWVVPFTNYAARTAGVLPETIPEEEWKPKKPTAVGDWWIRVTIPDAHNYTGDPAYAPFSIVPGLGDRFVDYVDIKLQAYTGRPSLTNFPYRIRLSEKNLPGFLYSRAGEDNAEELCFTDADGNILAYTQGAWDKRGESTVYVKISEIARQTQTIRLYWCLRKGAAVPPHAPETVFSDWTKQDADAQMSKLRAATFDLVVRNGYRVNYWKTRPKMSKTQWNVGEPAATVTPPTLAEGTFTTRYLDTVHGTGLADMPTAGGAYRISYELIDEKDGKTLVYELPCEIHVDFCILGETKMDDLKGGAASLTLGGRVFLANDDDAPGHEVTYQSYWHTNAAEGVWWTHEGTHAADYIYPNLEKYQGINHRLQYRDETGRTNLLWRLDDVILGNTFRYENFSDEGVAKVFLPYSTTGKPISGPTGVLGSHLESGWMVMRNSLDAAVYSPCYEGGIGTVYFDAINTRNTSGVGSYLHIAIDVMTNVTDEVTGEHYPPTDEYVQMYGKSTDWHRIPVVCLRRDNDEAQFSRLPQTTEEVELDITKGKSLNNFFRICAQVDWRGPARFRISRVSANLSGVGEDHQNYYIALDNIIVSFPRMTAGLKPVGRYDERRGGKQTVGQEGAFSVALPSLNDHEIYGRATNIVYVSGASNVNPKSMIQLSRLHYRWRYLDQRFDPDPAVTNELWRSVDLSPFDDYRAAEPLEVPLMDGDVEFFYESFTAIPYYDYYDYSGADPDRKTKLGGLYSEASGVVTNWMVQTEKKPWFFRYRAGKSVWSSISVRVEGDLEANEPMELVGDHLWRGLVKVPLGAHGRATFFFDGVDPWEGEWATKPGRPKQWYPTTDVKSLPGRGEARTTGGTFSFPLDDAAGYVEFQFNDENGVFTVGHAEYQTFNQWHDAHVLGLKGQEVFVGNSVSTSGVNVAEMVQTNAPMWKWTPFVTSDPNWREDFDLGNYLNPEYPKYTRDYISQKMPHAWNGQSGLFVDAQLTTSNLVQKQTAAGIAWQMQGYGRGSVSYTEKTVPDGLDTVTFQARLAQAVTWDAFSPCYGAETLMASDYTFVCPAVMSVDNGGDCAPNASMSVIGYYFPGVGCYEFRVTRDTSDGLTLSVYKWYRQQGAVSSELLGSKWFKGAVMHHSNTASDKMTDTIDPTPKMWAMYLSLGEDEAGATTILAGLTVDKADPSSEYQSVKYRSLHCVDAARTRLTFGTFGMLSTGCKGQFLAPRHWTVHQPTTSVKSWTDPSPGERATYPAMRGVSDSAQVDFINIGSTLNATQDGHYIDDGAWVYQPSRMQPCTNRLDNSNTLYGLKPEANLKQTVDVYVKRADGTDPTWHLVDAVTNTVTEYKFQEFKVPMQTNAQFHVKLQAGGWPTDVTVWNIDLKAWNGQDTPGIDGQSSDFVYTQAKVIEETKDNATNRYVTLQPARADAQYALSVRSPVLDGLGMIGFSYRDVQPGCRLLVQVATNDVRGNLGGNLGYNRSTNALPYGVQQEVATWLTLAEFDYDALKNDPAQAKTVYLGLHTRVGDALEGVFRVAVAPDVVREAAGKVRTDVDWGSVTLTDVYVHSEPALDTRSWIGFNLRMTGDAGDPEKRMYLPDTTPATSGSEIGLGMSAGLNNSFEQIEGGEAEKSKFDKVNPCVQSPTFGTVEVDGVPRQARIGRIRFRARLYETNSAALSPENVKPAKISLYGVQDGASTDWGTPVTNFTVETGVYRIFEYTAPAQRSFSAIRLMVDGVIAPVEGLDPQRVLLDEVVVSEKTDSSVAFVYARPFRNGLETDRVIEDIRDQGQQPLAGESWGVQTQLKLDQLADDIDVDRGFRVTFRYFMGKSPWGIDRWLEPGVPGVSEEAELVQVGSRTNWIFRSSARDPRTVVKPSEAGNAVVQYVVTAYYYPRGSDEELSAVIADSDVEDSGWTNPKWYEPVDFNDEYGEGHAHFSPYAILDAVSPGRVWINEVNWNDGTSRSTTNEFIEIAVPWGVDLKGWYLELTDINHKTVTLAEFGKNLPAMKQTEAGHAGDYDFMVLASPDTVANGPLTCGTTGEKVTADGAWADVSLAGTFPGAKLQYDTPYEFTLRRPSGIVEQRIVVGGTNELWGTEYDDYAYLYEGTNLVRELNEIAYSRQRFYAGDDHAKLADGFQLASFGVTTNGHGEAGAWSPEMRHTPGRINEGQWASALTGWNEPPHGGSFWVYLKVVGDHLTQKIGSVTNRDTFVVMTKADVTNVTYTAAPWYGIGALTRDGVTNAAATAQRTYTYQIKDVTNTTYIVATEGLGQALLDAQLDLNDPYAPAIVRWLSARSAPGAEDPLYRPDGPIVLGNFKGLVDTDTVIPLSLKDMYWLDMDPTKPGWWLRGGMADVNGTPFYRKRKWNDSWTEHYTNRIVKVRLYMENETDGWAKTRVTRLQGLGNERSDTFTGTWTSETFKVTAMLDNKLQEDFLPLRWFVFGPDSFGVVDGEDHTAKIEILDPFSLSSPGNSYGWYGWRGTSLFFRWTLDASKSNSRDTVEMLHSDSTYKPPFEPE